MSTTVLISTVGSEAKVRYEHFRPLLFFLGRRSFNFPSTSARQERGDEFVKKLCTALGVLAFHFSGATAFAQVATVYSGDNASGAARPLYNPGTYAMDTGCGPALGLGASNVLGFRPRFIQLADGYQVKLQGWHGNPGDTHCAGPSYSLVPPTCTNSKNLYDAGCVSNWVYDNVGGAVVIEKVPTPQTDSGVIATVYSGDNFSGKAVALRSQGTYAMDTGCGPALGLGAFNVLGFRPRSILLAAGRQVKLQGWHGNPGDTHCAGPSYSLVPSTCVNSKNLYDAGCLSNWVYDNVGGAVVLQ